MKLRETTKNEKYPSFKIGKMNDEGMGIPFGEKISIKLIDKFEPLRVSRIEKTPQGSWKSTDITSSNNPGDYVVVKDQSFIAADIKGSVIGDVVDNIKYNDFGNCSFEITQNQAKILQAQGDLKGWEIEFVSSTFEKTETDDEGNETVKKIKYFKINQITDDGTRIELSKNGKKEESSSPSPSTPKVAIPSAIQECNEEVAKIELNDVEKHVIKTIVSNPSYVDWIEFCKEGVDKFKDAYEGIAKVGIDEERAEAVYAEYLKRC